MAPVQSFPANDTSVGHELLGKFINAGGIQWKRANVLIPDEENEAFYLFSKVRGGGWWCLRITRLDSFVLRLHAIAINTHFVRDSSMREIALLTPRVLRKRMLPVS